MPADTPLRRRPVQQRSAQRVERMLAACAALVDELGYDGVTTTLIAERAGVAVGSLYQFFPDKRAVISALTVRNLDHFMRLVDKRLASVPLDHWWDAVDLVFDSYVQMFRDVAGFAQIRFGDVVDLRLMDDQRDNNTVIADRLAEVLADRFEIPRGDLRLPISVAVEATDGILNLAFRRKLFPEDVVIVEAKLVVRSYLTTHLERSDQPKQTPSPR